MKERLPSLAPAVDMTTQEGREAAGKAAFPRVGRLTSDKAVPDIEAWVSALAALDDVAPGPIGTTGYCMGARLAVRTATSHPEDVAACGGFHGGGLATDEPDSPHVGLGNARARFVFGHADKDRSMDPDAVARLGGALKDAGLEASNEIYEGAPHGYTMADTSAFHPEATERHFQEPAGVAGRDAEGLTRPAAVEPAGKLPLRRNVSAIRTVSGDPGTRDRPGGFST
ncbi:dienelactone hydrolase family protein [Pseudarthrobacter sp. Fe7]|nr:dienelactone hydrolase family protein [Pseudarthrobacter sp. Fe7]